MAGLPQLPNEADVFGRLDSLFRDVRGLLGSGSDPTNLGRRIASQGLMNTSPLVFLARLMFGENPAFANSLLSSNPDFSPILGSGGAGAPVATPGGVGAVTPPTPSPVPAPQGGPALAAPRFGPNIRDGLGGDGLSRLGSLIDSALAGGFTGIRGDKVNLPDLRRLSRSGLLQGGDGSFLTDAINRSIAAKTPRTLTAPLVSTTPTALGV